MPAESLQSYKGRPIFEQEITAVVLEWDGRSRKGQRPSLILIPIAMSMSTKSFLSAKKWIQATSPSFSREHRTRSTFPHICATQSAARRILVRPPPFQRNRHGRMDLLLAPAPTPDQRRRPRRLHTPLSLDPRDRRIMGHRARVSVRGQPLVHHRGLLRAQNARPAHNTQRNAQGVRFHPQPRRDEKMRNFTRIFLAMFGLLPWSCVPQMPPELILLPS